MPLTGRDAAGQSLNGWSHWDGCQTFTRLLTFMAVTVVSGGLSVTRQSTSLPGISISHVMPSTLTQPKRSATSASKRERGLFSSKVMSNRANPSVGIFWYDSASHSLFGVRKQEVTPAQMEAAACDGLPFIIYPETNEEVWQQEKFPGDYARTPRGRVSWVVNRFVVLVGSWARPIEDELTALLQAEFSLQSLELVFDEHWDVKP